MLSLIICIAYIIGIIMGLYLELYLSMVLFLLFICATLFLNCFNKKQKTNFKKVIIFIFLSCLIGFINITLRIYDFQYKYSERTLI